MKKFILSFFVICSFGVYVLWQKGNSNNQANLTQENPIVGAPTPTPSSRALSSNSGSKNIYKDGEYIGDSIDAYYGNVQVKVTISNGKITDVQFLDYPHNAGHSRKINSVAMPILRQETIQAQSAKVNAVSGASSTSPAFIKSLTSALNKAKA